MDLVTVVLVSPGARVVRQTPRYLYAELEDPITGAVDEVEFLVSLDRPIVGYRSQPRAGCDDGRSRERIHELRNSLGWQNVV